MAAWYLDPVVQPPPTVYRAEPLEPGEIDKLPDAARVWATIRAMREAHDAALDDFAKTTFAYCAYCQEELYGD